MSLVVAAVPLERAAAVAEDSAVDFEAGKIAAVAWDSGLVPARESQVSCLAFPRSWTQS